MMWELWWMVVALVTILSLGMVPRTVEVLLSLMLSSVAEKAVPMAAAKAEKMVVTVGPSTVEMLASVMVYWLDLT